MSLPAVKQTHQERQTCLPSQEQLNKVAKYIPIIPQLCHSAWTPFKRVHRLRRLGYWACRTLSHEKYIATHSAKQPMLQDLSTTPRKTSQRPSTLSPTWIAMMITMQLTLVKTCRLLATDVCSPAPTASAMIASLSDNDSSATPPTSFSLLLPGLAPAAAAASAPASPCGCGMAGRLLKGPSALLHMANSSCVWYMLARSHAASCGAKKQ